MYIGVQEAGADKNRSLYLESATHALPSFPYLPPNFSTSARKNILLFLKHSILHGHPYKLATSLSLSVCSLSLSVMCVCVRVNAFVCVCVCVCARARECVRLSVCVCESA